MPPVEREPPDIERLKKAADTEGLIQALGFPLRKVQEKSAKALAEMGPAVIPSLLRHFTPREDAGIREGSGEVIRLLGNQAMVPLKRALGHADERVRASAAMALGYQGKAAAPVLLEALDDSSREVRTRAAYALEMTGWVIPADDTRTRVMYHLVRGDLPELVRMKKAAFPVLVTFLRDRNYQIRLDAVRALGQVRSRKAVPVLVRMLADPESGIRSAVVEAVGEIGAPEAAPYLARTLTDSSLNVRIETAWALEKLGWKPKTADEKVRYCIAKEQWDDLSRIGSESIPVLILALTDDHAHVRTRIADVLAGMGAPAVRALEQVKREGKPDLRTRADETLAAIRKKTGAKDGLAGAGGRNSVDWLLSDQESATDRRTGAAAGGGSDATEDAAPETPRQKVARISAVLHDPDAAIRVAAVEALRVVGMPAEKTLIRALKDEHKSVRSAAAESLGSLKSTAAVPYLIRLLRTDPVKDVRRAAAESLGLIEDAYAIPALVRGFRDRDPLVRSAAAAALGRMGSAARDQVIAAIRDSNALVRSSAFLALGDMRDSELLPSVVTGFTDPHPDVRNSAAMALKAFAVASPAEYLEIVPGLLLKGAEPVRRAILETLAGCDEEPAVWILRALARDADEAIRTRAGEILAQKTSRLPAAGKRQSLSADDEAAIRALIARLEDQDPAVRNRAVGQLKKAGAPAARLLLAALPGQPPQVRDVTAGIVASVGEHALDDVIGAVQDEDPVIRASVVRILGMVSHEKSVRALGWVLYAEEVPEIRAAAAASLGSLGSREGVRPLIHALSDVPLIRNEAVRALGKTGGGEAVTALIGLLAASDGRQMPLVMQALGQCGADARETLASALGEGTKAFRMQVALTLDSLGWQPEDPFGKIRYLVAKEAWTELGRIGAPALDSLIAALDDEDEANRSEIARVIGLFGESAFGPLSIALSDERVRVRRGAALALGHLGGIAQAPLKKALKDGSPEVRLEAARSLDRTGWVPGTAAETVAFRLAGQDWDALVHIGKPAVAGLVRLVKDADLQLQENAIRTLGIIRDARAIPYLVQAAEKSGDPRFVQAVLSALGEMGDSRVQGFLRRELTDPDFSVRTEAARALGKTGWNPANDADKVMYYVAREDAVMLARMGPDAVPLFLAALSDDQILGRLVISEALVILGEPGIQALEQAEKSADPTIRSEARDMLGVIRADREADSLREGAGTRAGEGGHAGALDAAAREMSFAQARNLLASPDGNARITAAGLLAALGTGATEDLFGLVSDEDDSVRAAAFLALGRIRAAAAVPDLIRGLEDPDDDIRKAAAGALGEIRHSSAIPSLVRGYSDPAAEVRSHVINALAGFGPMVLLPVLDAAEDPRPEVRAAALDTLGRLGGFAVLHPLVKALGDPEDQVRFTAAQALGAMAPDPRLPVMDVLTEIVSRGSRLTRCSALDALARVDDESARALISRAAGDPDEQVRNAARDLLARFQRGQEGSPAGEALPPAGDRIASFLAALSDPDPAARAGAARALLQEGNAAVRPLLSALREADAEVSGTIMEVLLGMGERILDDIIAAFSDDSVNVRRAAATLAGNYPQGRSVLALGRALYSESDEDVRQLIAESLGRLGDGRGVKPLIDSLEDGSRPVRLAAIRSLGLIGDAMAAGPLIRELADEDYEIVYVTEEALGRIGPAARPALAKALRSGDHTLRSHVAEILEEMKSIPRDPAEKAWFLIGKERWYDLDEIGTPALAPLVEVLADRNVHVRIGAVTAISRIGGTGAIPPLVAALGDPSPIVRKRAENALVAIGSPAADVLREAIDRGSMRDPSVAERVLDRIASGRDGQETEGTGEKPGSR